MSFTIASSNLGAIRRSSPNSSLLAKDCLSSSFYLQDAKEAAVAPAFQGSSQRRTYWRRRACGNWKSPYEGSDKFFKQHYPSELYKTEWFWKECRNKPFLWCLGKSLELHREHTLRMMTEYKKQANYHSIIYPDLSSHPQHFWKDLADFCRLFFSTDIPSQKAYGPDQSPGPSDKGAYSSAKAGRDSKESVDHDKISQSQGYSMRDNVPEQAVMERSTEAGRFDPVSGRIVSAMPKIVDVTGRNIQEGNDIGAMASSQASLDGKDNGKLYEIATEPNAQARRFDPVSGRMVPAMPQADNISITNTEKHDGEHFGDALEKEGENNVVPTESVETSTVPREPSHGPELGLQDSLQDSNRQVIPETTVSAANMEKPEVDGQTDRVREEQTSDEVIAKPAPAPEPLEPSGGPETEQVANLNTPSTLSSSTKYEDLENIHERERNEDLDLLQASDIRASYGPQKRKQDSKAQKQHRREALEREFDSSVAPVNDAPAQDIQTSQPYVHSLKTSGTHEPESALSSHDIKAEPKPENNNETIESHSNPTVSDEKVENLQETAATEQSSKQEQEQFSNAELHPAKAKEYRILAYDSSTQNIITAETTSSTYDQYTKNKSIEPSEILSRLNNPAKFIYHLGEMQRDGYEIVSGGGDILVFRKVSSEDNSTVLPESTSNNNNATIDTSADADIRGTIAKSADQKDHSTTHNEREQELPFTEPPSTIGGKFRRTIHRMILAGSATAATCYAIGAVCEFFRTGGADGRGFDAFTVLESERKDVR